MSNTSGRWRRHLFRAIAVIGTIIAVTAQVRAADCAAPRGFSELDAAIAKSLGTGTPGVAVAVICNSKLVYEKSIGDAQLEPKRALGKNSVFRLASITKPVTAAVILRLAEQHKLSLDDRLSKYLPDFPGANGITLYHLLTHTAGIADFTEDASYPTHKTRPHSNAEMIAWIASLNPVSKFAPGTAWAYSNSGYVLLGAVIEKVTSTDLQRAFADHLLQPSDAGTVAFDLTPLPNEARALGYRLDRDKKLALADPVDMSIPGAAGALRGTAADFATLADAIFTARAITPESRTRMTSPGLLADGQTNRWGMPKAWREGLQADYGLGVFIDNKTGRRRWWHSGDIDGFHTWFAHLPDERVTIVILRNSESGDPMEDAIQDAFWSRPR